MKRFVVYNNCFGGAGLSKEAVMRARELGASWALPGELGGDCTLAGELYNDGEVADDMFDSYVGMPYGVYRHDPILVQVVKELGRKAGGPYSNLQIAEVDGKYRIDEYDGSEIVMTPEEYGWV